MFKRPIFGQLLARLREERGKIQVLAGARQVGKTTLAQQTLQALEIPSVYASADGALPDDHTWIEEQWHRARLKAKADESTGALLVLDEVQKVGGWSEVIKRLWDEDSAARVVVKVLLLGSSPLLVQRGLSERLAGRFELIRVPHWTFSEMEEAFGWNLEKFLYFGGYPGAAPLVGDRDRWASYVLDSLVEATVSRDILLMTRVDKPALLRRLFQLGCQYSSQILSYQKMTGQLRDAGNTTTLAHYLDLLSGAGMLAGIPKYAGERVRQRASSPKLQVLNTALISAQSSLPYEDALVNPEFWGRLVESAVGAHLIGGARADMEVFYWRDRNREVDFIARKGNFVTAIEVKSGRGKTSLPGMEAFDKAHHPDRKLLVGEGGIALDEFLGTPACDWVSV
jgi:predicted AAA+ superfamily ATPase